MVAPARKAAFTANDGATTGNISTLPVTLPTGLVAGDTAIFVMSNNAGAATFSAPDGTWQLLFGPIDSATNFRTYVWVKDLGSADSGTTVNFTASVAGRLLGVGEVWTGSSASDVLAGQHPSPSITTAGTTSVTAPSLTTANTNSGICQLWGLRDAAASSATATMTTPTGTTLDTSAATAYSTAPNYRLQPAYRQITAAGTYGGQTVTTSRTVNGTTVYVIEVPEHAPPPPPDSVFTSNVSSGVAPLGVNFTDASTGSPTSWSWTFGDGGTSTARNPSHTYTAAGTYTVTLTASNVGGADATPATATITVSPPSMRTYLNHGGVYTPLTGYRNAGGSYV